MRSLITKQIRMLEMLDQQILDCEDCSLCRNGRCKPYWTNGYYGSVIIGDFPNLSDLEQGEPFSGKTGDILWEEMANFGLAKERFLIINAVNCRTIDKPGTLHIKACDKWYRKYLHVVKPNRVLFFGKYAINKIVNWDPVEKNAYVHHGYDYNHIKFDLVFSVHPEYAINNGDKGRDLLRKSIKAFAGLSK